MCLELPCVSLSVSVEHAGVKQTSGAASLAAGARIGSGLIGQLAPAPAPASTTHINVKQSLLAFYTP